MPDINHRKAQHAELLQIAKERCSELKTAIISCMSESVKHKIIARELTPEDIATDYILRRWDFFGTHKYEKLTSESSIDRLGFGLGYYKELTFDEDHEIITDIRF